MHGVSRVDSAESTMVKIAWILMILLSLSAGLYIITKSVNDFYSYDVITNVERVTPHSVTVPAVTLCLYPLYDELVYINDTYVKTIVSNNASMRDFVWLTSKDLEYFQIDYDHMDCVRFNGLNANVKVNSVSKFFEIPLLRNLTKTISETEYHIYQLWFPFIHVYVSDNYLNSFLKISPNFRVNHKLGEANTHEFHISKTEIERKLGEPYNRCDPRKQEAYRQLNCIDVCINREIWDKYGCSIPSYYRNNDYELCGNTNIVEDYYFGFVLDSSQLNTTGHINEFYDSCERECPKECVSVKLTTTYKAEWYNAQPNFAFFKFYLADLSTLEITQIPKMTTYDLISNVGGTLGLFVGISFLSFVEFFQLIFEIFLIMCSIKSRA